MRGELFVVGKIEVDRLLDHALAHRTSTKPLPDRLHWMDLIKEAQSDPDNVIRFRGAALAMAADRAGLSPRAAARFYDVVDPVELHPDDCDPNVIAVAESLERRWTSSMEEWKRAWNSHPEMRRDPTSVQSARSASKRPSSKEPKRKALFGHPVTSVIRWMGCEGWTVEDAMKVLKALNLSIAESTVRIQLKAGKKGERGAPAELSLAQELELSQHL